MVNKAMNIKIIGYALALLYALSLVYLGYALVPDFELPIVILTVLFAVLLICSIAVSRLEPWGRTLMVFGNAVLFICLVILNVTNQKVIPGMHIVMSIVCILFFGQSKIRRLFEEEKNFLRKSVLVVDDDPALLKTLKPILLANGYSVLIASTGEKGLQIARKQKPDLIILDVILPGVKGREVCNKLKEDDDTKSIPVIFLTAKDSPDDVQAEIAVGGMSHITKPFKPARLLEEVKGILGN